MYRREITDDRPVILLDFFIYYPVVRHLVGEPARPLLRFALRRSRLVLVRFRLVDERHEKVAVRHGVEHPVEHRQGELETGVAFDPRERERYYRDVSVSGAFERFAQKGDVI